MRKRVTSESILNISTEALFNCESKLGCVVHYSAGRLGNAPSASQCILTFVLCDRHGKQHEG